MLKYGNWFEMSGYSKTHGDSSKKTIHEIETCRDRVSQSFVGSYFILVYKGAYIHVVKSLQLYSHFCKLKVYVYLRNEWRKCIYVFHIYKFQTLLHSSLFPALSYILISHYNSCHFTSSCILISVTFIFKPLYSKSCSKSHRYSSNTHKYVLGYFSSLIS